MNKALYRTIRQISESGRYPFTIGQLRYYLMFRHKNGLKKAVRKIGKRIYLREDLFEEWIESQNSTGERA
jgi:hypothetical protein